MSKKLKSYGRSHKYETYVGIKDKKENCYAFTKAEHKRIDDWLKKHTPKMKFSLKKIKGYDYYEKMY